MLHLGSLWVVALCITFGVQCTAEEESLQSARLRVGVLIPAETLSSYALQDLGLYGIGLGSKFPSSVDFVIAEDTCSEGDIETTMQSLRHADVIIGPFCPGTCQASANITSLWNTPQLSPACDTHFSHFIRTEYNADDLVGGLVSFLDYYKFPKVALVTLVEPELIGLVQKAQRELEALDHVDGVKLFFFDKSFWEPHSSMFKGFQVIVGVGPDSFLLETEDFIHRYRDFNQDQVGAFIGLRIGEIEDPRKVYSPSRGIVIIDPLFRDDDPLRSDSTESRPHDTCFRRAMSVYVRALRYCIDVDGDYRDGDRFASFIRERSDNLIRKPIGVYNSDKEGRVRQVGVMQPNPSSLQISWDFDKQEDIIWLNMSHTVARRVSPTIKIGAFIPWTGWPVGDTISSAVPMAVDDINNSSLLGDTMIEWMTFDDKCNAGASLAGAFTMKNKGADVFIGPSCSLGCEPVALVAAQWNFPLISWSCGSTELSNTERYPTFSRTCAPLTSFVPQVVGLFKMNGWERAAIISDSDNHLISTISHFAEELTAAGVNVLVSTLSPGTDYLKSMQLVKQAGRNIILFFLWGKELRDALLVWKELDMLGPGYAYIGIGAGISYADMVSDSPDGRDQEAKDALDGFVLIEPSYSGGNEYYDFLQQVRFRMLTDFDITVPPEVEISSWATLLYDAVWLYAHAVNHTVAHGGDYRDGRTLSRSISQITFEGKSGPVRLNHKGDRIMRADIINVVNGSFKLAGTASAYPSVEYQRFSDIIWPGGTIDVPESWDAQAKVFFEESTTIDTICVITIIAALFWTSFVFLFLIARRNDPVVKKASFVFCLLSSLSCIALALGSIFYNLSPGRGDWVCIYRLWFTYLPYTVFVSSLAVKIYRIWLLFKKKKSVTFRVPSNLCLLSIMAIPVVLEIASLLLLTFWPLTAAIESDVYSNIWVCTDDSAEYNIWSLANVIYSVFLLCVLVLLAFLGRDVPSDFNESWHILMCSYAMSFAAMVVLPIQFLTDGSNPQRNSLIRSIIQSGLASTVCVFVFTPKIYYIFYPQSSTSGVSFKKPKSLKDVGKPKGSSGKPAAVATQEYTFSFDSCDAVDKDRLQDLRDLARAPKLSMSVAYSGAVSKDESKFSEIQTDEIFPEVLAEISHNEFQVDTPVQTSSQAAALAETSPGELFVDAS